MNSSWGMNGTSCNFNSCEIRNCSQTSGCKYYYSDGESEQCYASDEDLLHCIHEYIYPSVAELVLAPIFITCFIIGLVGNSLVIWAVCHNANLRTTTNVLLTNLAVADLMAVLLRMPADFIQTLWETWFLGNAMCKIVEMYQVVVVLVSVLTLTAISVERWFAICRALTFRQTRARLVYCLLAIWTFSHLAAVPRAVFYGAIPDLIIPQNLTILMTSCIPVDYDYTLIHEAAVFAVFYVLPLIVMAFTYTSVAYNLWSSTHSGVFTEADSSAIIAQLNARRRTAKMLIVIVIIFSICHLPIYAWNMVRFSRVTLESLSPGAMAGITLGSHLLGLFVSCINPVIYNFMSVKFRREFQEACVCCRQLTASCSKKASKYEMKQVANSSNGPAGDDNEVEPNTNLTTFAP